MPRNVFLARHVNAGHGLGLMTRLLAPSLALTANLLLRQIKADSAIV